MKLYKNYLCIPKISFQGDKVCADAGRNKALFHVSRDMKIECTVSSSSGLAQEEAANTEVIKWKKESENSH